MAQNTPLNVILTQWPFLRPVVILELHKRQHLKLLLLSDFSRIDMHGCNAGLFKQNKNAGNKIKS